jgi:hypothetical protein
MVKILNVVQVKIESLEQYESLLEECKKRSLEVCYNPEQEVNNYFRYSKYFKAFSAWCHEPNFPEISEEEFIKFLDY